MILIIYFALPFRNLYLLIIFHLFLLSNVIRIRLNIYKLEKAPNA